MPLEEVVSLTMRGVSEIRDAPIPAARNRTVSALGTRGIGEGKTETKRKKDTEIMAPVANASRHHRYPQFVAAFRFTRKLLTIQVDTAKENTPNRRLTDSRGALSQTQIPSHRFKTAARKIR